MQKKKIKKSNIVDKLNWHNFIKKDPPTLILKSKTRTVTVASSSSLKTTASKIVKIRV